MCMKFAQNQNCPFFVCRNSDVYSISMVSCQKGKRAKTRFFRRAVQSFLIVLQCVIITCLRSYLKLQNAIQHEMHAIFDVTIHFPKFSFILILHFIRPFGIGVYALLLSTTVHSLMMVRYILNVSHLPYFGAYALLRKLIRHFVFYFFSFWRIG